MSAAAGARAARTRELAAQLYVAHNFIECDREQAFLMPPSLREWLPEDHLAWLVIESVEEMDLAEFYADYRSDGHGRAAYEPPMMVALLLYACATKQRSARGIERHCRQDVAHPRRYAVKNRQHLNRLLLLIQLHINGDDDVQAYSTTIRRWLEANGGQPTHRRRSIADRRGLPSLR